LAKTHSMSKISPHDLDYFASHIPYLKNDTIPEHIYTEFFVYYCEQKIKDTNSYYDKLLKDPNLNQSAKKAILFIQSKYPPKF